MMNSMGFAFLSNGNLHHAYGIEGALRSDLIPVISKEMGIKIAGNPDFFSEKFESFSIDDARRIKEIHDSKKFYETAPRVFLIELFSITHGAQNALLKVLEEPKPGNYFFFSVPSLDIFLPTVRSRLCCINAREGWRGSTSQDSECEVEPHRIQHFLDISPKERIAYVDKLAFSISEEEVSKSEALFFLNALEKRLYSNRKNPKDNIEVLEAIAKARAFLSDSSSSVKMLLEHIALSL